MPDPRLDRRGLLRAAAAGTVLASIGGVSVPAAASPARRAGEAARTTATLRWLGTAGWRVDIGSRTLLVDPFLTRFSTGLFAGAFDPNTPLSVDTAVIDAHVGRPELVLVTHGHWDHYNDVPHIARSTGARVVGTLSTYNLGLAYQLPGTQLSPVKGGEVFEFGDYTVEVIAALHSRNASYSMVFPGLRINPPPQPQTIADLPEGDTLAYQVRVAGGPSIFFMGASDFVERNLTGLAPDVAMIALATADATHAYVPRLIVALDQPAVVVPVHWDNFERPLQNPPTTTPANEQRLDAFTAAVRRAAPGTQIIRPEYLTPYTFR